MMMYNRDYVNDWIEFDRMDVDEDDEKHLKMVVGNTVVENQHHPNWMRSELMMMMLEYYLDWELLNHWKNYLTDPKSFNHLK